MSYVIIADSGVDLPQEIISQFNLPLAHFSVTLDGKNFPDTDMEPKEIMDLMRNGATPKTSQVSVSDFEELFEKYINEGKEIIYIAFSSGLSGTYNSACLAKQSMVEKYPECDITVIDTKCASTGGGLVVYKALCMQRDGATKQEVIDATIYNSENMEHIFTVETLEYLFKGGRVSRTSAVLGGILGIKPILHVDEDGTLKPIEKVRGRKVSIKRLAEIAGEKGYDLDKQTIGIVHGDCMDAVEELKGYMTSMYGSKKFIVSQLGTTIGAHAGPGTLAVFFLSK